MRAGYLFKGMFYPEKEDKSGLIISKHSEKYRVENTIGRNYSPR
jgi:hypothetical protein